MSSRVSPIEITDFPDASGFCGLLALAAKPEIPLTCSEPSGCNDFRIYFEGDVVAGQSQCHVKQRKR